MGGMVLETNMTEILLRIEEQNKIAKEEVIKLRDTNKCTLTENMGSILFDGYSALLHAL